MRLNKKQLISHPIVKLCGNRNTQSVRALLSPKPDWLGFIFYKKSPRYFSEDPALLFPISHIKVGVFVNERIEKILHIAQKASLQYVQLHGDETPKQCEQIQKKIPVIKAVGISSSYNFDALKNFQDYVTYFLFDTKCKQKGGGGIAYDRTVLNQYELSIPYFISGGIAYQEAVTLLSNPLTNMHGIDINSHFENDNYEKNVHLVKKLMEQKKGLYGF